MSRGRDGGLSDGKSHDARDFSRGESTGGDGIDTCETKVSLLLSLWCAWFCGQVAFFFSYLDTKLTGADSLRGSIVAEAVTACRTSEAVSWQVVLLARPLRVRLQVSLLVRVLVVQTGTLLVVMAVTDDISSAQGDEEEEEEPRPEWTSEVSVGNSGMTVAVMVIVTSAPESSDEVTVGGAEEEDEMLVVDTGTGSGKTVAVTKTVVSASAAPVERGTDEEEEEEENMPVPVGCWGNTVAVTKTVVSASPRAEVVLAKRALVELGVDMLPPPLGVWVMVTTAHSVEVSTAALL